MSYLDALSHAFAVFANLLVPDIRQPNEGKDVFSTCFGFIPCHPMQASKCGDKIKASHPVIQFLGFTDITQTMIGGWILEGVRPKQSNLSLTGLQSTDDNFQECRFPGTIHSENASNSTTDGQTHIVQTDDLPIPLGDMIDHDCGSLGDLRPLFLRLTFANLVNIRHHSRVTSRGRRVERYRCGAEMG